MTNYGDVGLDFETYCDVSIRQVGLDAYVNHPSFQPLIASTEFRHPNLGLTRRDFILYGPNADEQWEDLTGFLRSSAFIAAHNAQFERAVLHTRDLDFGEKVVDTAAIVRSKGASGSLAKAVPQIRGSSAAKLSAGERLVRKFCMGGLMSPDQMFNDPDWPLFLEYCYIDASLTRAFLQVLGFSETDQTNERVSEEINRNGWYVDLDLVKAMDNAVEHNKAQALAEFRAKHEGEPELNLTSYPQLKLWCEKRGVRVKSFNKEAMPKMMAALRKRIAAGTATDGHREVLELLETKELLGGNSVAKLPVLQRMVGPDGRLRYQYMHIGAGQTHRTTGVGVQMQNLKKLPDDHLAEDDLQRIITGEMLVDNEVIGENLRQVFRAEDPNGMLIVGDLAAIESRGLAYIAGEQWKLDEFKAGKDMYKVLAAKKYGVPYEDITSAERQFGKTGELSCGYGAGGGAVQRFAAKMNQELTIEEANNIVFGWRAINGKIVELWRALDEHLQEGIVTRKNSVLSLEHVTIYFQWRSALQSIQAIHPGAVDLEITMTWPKAQYGMTSQMTRHFRGVYKKGREIIYHKPTMAKTGPLWKDKAPDKLDPKKMVHHTVYGGKLAGILTQSFCREIFFYMLREVSSSFQADPWTTEVSNVKLIGQFHDEIILEWAPKRKKAGDMSLDGATKTLKNIMGTTPVAGLPIATKIQTSYRYNK